ncbi:anaerobic sulfatase maturase [Bifidobacterium simiarum]|uniref:anaerobic sulfatase maturase n=1 Tax=Bifidobacterium simiarum TaxID=2045441 RepID=UPI001BDDBA22|nr:anaerobic sulfatase maturase [Bifidobacterium simiarum]MBT1166944.1 anaerobic sulfatase maturase [Bifidobacterium simiarum]
MLAADRRNIPFSAVCKPAGAACNINCEYCFFLSKDLLFDERGQRMSDETLETYIREYLFAQPDGPVEVPWQGGEPTLRGVEFFERTSELIRRYARPGQRVRQSIQTNATLINERWCELLRRENFLVGVSIDGPKEIHDRYRVNKAGRGTFDLTERGWRLLKQYGVETSLLCTVNNNNAKHPTEVYRFFRDDLGADFIQFIPIVERVPRQYRREAEHGWIKTSGERILYRQQGDEVTSRTVRPDDYGTFMTTIFDEWATHDVGRVYIQQVDSMLANYFGRPTLCTHSRTCGDALAVLHNGDVYSCDHFVEPGYRLGNITDPGVGFADLVGSAQQQAFGSRKSGTLPQRCLSCPMRWACNGGCPKDRLTHVEGERFPVNYLCRGFYRFFSHATPYIVRMAKEMMIGRSPEAMMRGMREMLAAETERNAKISQDVLESAS